MNVLKLQDILNRSVLLQIDAKDSAVIIREHSQQSKIKTLRIHHVPKNCVAFTLDHYPSAKELTHCFRQLSCYFEPSTPIINKGCDAVLIGEYQSKFLAIVVDLKSDRIKPRQLNEQLRNSEIFVRYIIDVLNTHFPDHALNITRYVRVVVTTRIKKASTYKPNDALFAGGVFEVNPYPYNGVDCFQIAFESLFRKKT